MNKVDTSGYTLLKGAIVIAAYFLIPLTAYSFAPSSMEFSGEIDDAFAYCLWPLIFALELFVGAIKALVGLFTQKLYGDTIFIVIAAISIAGWVFVARMLFISIDESIQNEIAEQQKRENAATERERMRLNDLANEKAHKDQQQRYGTELMILCNESLGCFEKMPSCLQAAESALDTAEQDFNEGVFAPFWDSIEKATMKLGEFDNFVTTIYRNHNRYKEILISYEFAAPEFPIGLDSVKGMAVGNSTAIRLKAIVRSAQRNFHFASIYEQRKTNQILIAGFANLAQALDGMGRRLSDSIENLSMQVAESVGSLSHQVSEMSTVLENSMQVIGGQIADHYEAAAQVAGSIDKLHSTTQEGIGQTRERHDRALDMLDNIQRRRAPISDSIAKQISTRPLE